MPLGEFYVVTLINNSQLPKHPRLFLRGHPQRYRRSGVAIVGGGSDLDLPRNCQISPITSPSSARRRSACQGDKLKYVGHHHADQGLLRSGWKSRIPSTSSSRRGLVLLLDAFSNRFRVLHFDRLPMVSWRASIARRAVSSESY